jgi:uncharacterized protein
MAAIGNWILTHKGHAFSFEALDSNVYDLDDIAHALALSCRFGGMTDYHYSVAQHSCYMAEEIFRETRDPVAALDGLMHDAEEYVMGDMKTPLKNMMPEFRAMSARVDAHIRAEFNKFGVPLEMQPLTKEYDTRILLDEKYALLPSDGPVWEFEKTHKPLGIIICKWSPQLAEQRFRELFKFYSSVYGA